MPPEDHTSGAPKSRLMIIPSLRPTTQRGPVDKIFMAEATQGRISKMVGVPPFHLNLEEIVNWCSKLDTAQQGAECRVSCAFFYVVLGIVLGTAASAWSRDWLFCISVASIASSRPSGRR